MRLRRLRFDHPSRHDPIAPSNVVAPAGRVTLAVENHRVEEADPTVAVVAQSRTLAGDERDDVVIDLRPGRDVLVSTLPHHDVRNGMVATLIVR